MADMHVLPFLVPPSLQGWKDRYVVLMHGKLTYFKNEKVCTTHINIKATQYFL